MIDRIDKFGLQVARPLYAMIEQEALPLTGVASDQFWRGLSDLIHVQGPRNRALLAKRNDLQEKINAWHQGRRGAPVDAAAYRALLLEIGYLVPQGPDFTVDTANVDPEISDTPGPQLVVPVMNARYALNAANARWGSLYDALYGTDAMGDAPHPGGYDAERGARVIAYRVAGGKLRAEMSAGETGLADPSLFAGYGGEAGAPGAILLTHNRLYL